MKVEYKIRFHSGLRDDAYFDINEAEYNRLKDAMELQSFLVKVERAYEHIVDNYHDFEKNNFSIILKNELYLKDSPSRIRKQYNSFVKHLLNVLTSTYLYTSVLKPSKSDSKEVSILKKSFKVITNGYHKTRYQYTFMSALRNKLNHGGTLPGGYTSGGYWSLYWNEEKSKEVGIRIKNMDQRFSNLDYKILKQYAEQIIDNRSHFSSVEKKIPDEFYLRQAIRVYIDLLSIAHAEIRINAKLKNKEFVELIKKYFSKVDGHFYAATLVNEKVKDIDMFLSEKTIKGMQKSNLAPLHIEYYAGMPGEHRDLPVLDEPIQKRK